MKAAIQIPRYRERLEQGVLNGDDPVATDFARAMTHELRTPLNAIIGLCQLLERDSERPLSPSQRDAIDRMERNARTLLQSINHLLVCVRTGHFE